MAGVAAVPSRVRILPAGRRIFRRDLSRFTQTYLVG
jgi:hypothetical protein